MRNSRYSSFPTAKQDVMGLRVGKDHLNPNHQPVSIGRSMQAGGSVIMFNWKRLILVSG